MRSMHISDLLQRVKLLIVPCSALIMRCASSLGKIMLRLRYDSDGGNIQCCHTGVHRFDNSDPAPSLLELGSFAATTDSQPHRSCTIGPGHGLHKYHTASQIAAAAIGKAGPPCMLLPYQPNVIMRVVEPNRSLPIQARGPPSARRPAKLPS